MTDGDGEVKSVRIVIIGCGTLRSLRISSETLGKLTEACGDIQQGFRRIRPAAEELSRLLQHSLKIKDAKQRLHATLQHLQQDQWQIEQLGPSRLSVRSGGKVYRASRKGAKVQKTFQQPQNTLMSIRNMQRASAKVQAVPRGLNRQRGRSCGR